MAEINLTPNELIRRLIELLEAANRLANVPTRACYITVPDQSAPRCANLTAEQCEAAGGVFDPDNDCP